MGLKIATVKFKSIPKFYEKEKKYIKTNTVENTSRMMRGLKF